MPLNPAGEECTMCGPIECRCWLHPPDFPCDWCGEPQNMVDPFYMPNDMAFYCSLCSDGHLPKERLNYRKTFTGSIYSLATGQYFNDEQSLR